jgi:hypothetical protein
LAEQRGSRSRRADDDDWALEQLVDVWFGHGGAWSTSG